MTQPEQTKPDFFARLYRTLGPIAGGLLLDFADLTTFGPFGVFTGLFIGAAVTFWICSIYRFSVWTKVVISLLGGLYCMVPMTEPFPLATLTTIICRFFEIPPKPPSSDNAPQPPRKYVDSETIENQQQEAPPQ